MSLQPLSQAELGAIPDTREADLCLSRQGAMPAHPRADTPTTAVQGVWRAAGFGSGRPTTQPCTAASTNCACVIEPASAAAAVMNAAGDSSVQTGSDCAAACGVTQAQTCPDGTTCPAGGYHFSTDVGGGNNCRCMQTAPTQIQGYCSAYEGLTLAQHAALDTAYLTNEAVRHAATARLRCVQNRVDAANQNAALKGMAWGGALLGAACVVGFTLYKVKKAYRG
jgi:hypothetical protein